MKTKQETAPAAPGTDTPAAGMNDDQAADLRALTAAALEPEAEATLQAETEQEAQSVALLDKNRAGLSMLLGLAAPTLEAFNFPHMAGVLKDKGEILAGAWAPVLTKYGVDMESLGMSYKEEIGAALITLPIALALREAFQKDGNAPAPALPAAVAPPTSGTVRTGPVDTLGTPAAPVAAMAA